jgi:hypothetical protein
MCDKIGGVARDGRVTWSNPFSLLVLPFINTIYNHFHAHSLLHFPHFSVQGVYT